MRKSVHLLLAAGLAGSAFAGLAAQQQAESTCDNPDGLAVVTVDEAFEHDYFGSPSFPLNGIVGESIPSVDFLVDAGEASKVRFTITWTDGVSDYDMGIYTGGTELARPFAAGADRESADVKLDGCVRITAEVENFAGDPTTPVTLTAKIV